MVTVLIFGIIGISPTLLAVQISVEPASLEVSPGELFPVNITVYPEGAEIYAAQYDLNFDSILLNATSQTKGTFLTQDGADSMEIANRINNTIGKIEYGEFRTGVDYGVTTQGVLASISFEAVKPGTAYLNLSNILLSDSNGTSIETEVTDGTIVIGTEQPVYPANSVYFVPEHSTGKYCENNTTIQIRVNTSVATPGLDMNITFNPNCVDITAVDWTGSAWPGMPPTMSPIYKHNSDNVFISSLNFSGPSGDNLLATITLHCQNATGDCSSYINFSKIVISDVDGNAINTAWHNGTFECTEESTGSPDLVPTEIKVTHNYYNGAWAMLNNTVNVTVENIDSGDSGAFDVKLYAQLNGDFEEVGSETVTSLPSGDSTEASFVWEPSEAGDYNLKAVVDPDNAIAESNETNNELIELQYAGHNGYMDDKPLTTYAHGKIKGNISFTHGDSFYSGLVDSDGTYTVNHTVDIPDGATLKFARLYSYWTWCPDYPVMNLTFDGNTVSPDRKYTDRKGWGSYYDYPTGTYGYNVTSFVTGSGSHTTVVKNTGTQSFAMDGIGLLLVYTDTNGKDIEYWINEGADMLSTMDTSGGLMPEEATAQALFSGAIDLNTVSGAWLWTIVQSGGCTGNMLMFNDCDWTGVYDGTPYSDLDIDERRDVSGCLNTNDHLVQIQAADYPAGGDYLVPSNAFLVVEYEGEVMIHDINVTTDYTGAVNGIKLLKNGAAIPAGHSLIIGEDYTIRSRIVNEGDFDETVNVTIEVANETGTVFLENFDKQINVSDSKDAYRTWNTAGLVPGEYSITVNASIPEDAHPADNERTREVALTSEEITYNVTITAEPDEQKTTPDANAAYTLTITNTGTVADTIELTIPANEADAAILSDDTLMLNANENATVSLNVKDADAGIYNTTVRATSQGNTSVFNDVTVKTTVVTAGLPTADYLKIPDASGSPGTYVEVPVRIANVMNGPVQGIRLTVDYAESVLNLTSISSGNLTSGWTTMHLGNDGHTMILATNYTNDAIPDGSSGSVVRLNFSVIGSPGDTSPVNLSFVELSNPDGEVGTAPAENGNFTVTVVPPPTADDLKIPDASGRTGTHVEVPVNITNVQNGPIQGIRLEVDYNESVLNMTNISSIDLTSTWTDIQLGTDGHTMILATDNTNDAIPDGSNGTVVWMNFSVIGSYGDTSPMNLSFIELSNPDGEVGTAQEASNGTFTVTPEERVEGRITYICNETGIAGVNINLTNADSVQTTLTNETGYYNFTDVSPDDYVVSATKPRFWDNSSNVTVIEWEVTTVNMTLYLKGDLNDDGVSADAGDVMLMLQASARDITGDYQYDLNENGVIADAGDVVLILRASVGDIILW